jgi:hypothetical protein
VIRERIVPAARWTIAYLVFALIGTLGVGIDFTAGDRSDRPLAELKDWMSRHNAISTDSPLAAPRRSPWRNVAARRASGAIGCSVH